MKLIILLIISFNSYADVEVNISNIFSDTFRGKFKTQLEADAWIADNISNDSWGKKARWVRSDSLPNTDSCIELKDVIPEIGEQYELCKLDKEYTIVITDITAEVEAEEANKAADKLRADELKAKDKDKMKLDELVELLKLKGII